MSIRKFFCHKQIQNLQSIPTLTRLPRASERARSIHESSRSFNSAYCQRLAHTHTHRPSSKCGDGRSCHCCAAHIAARLVPTGQYCAAQDSIVCQTENRTATCTVYGSDRANEPDRKKERKAVRPLRLCLFLSVSLSVSQLFLFCQLKEKSYLIILLKNTEPTRAEARTRRLTICSSSIGNINQIIY